MDYPPEPDVLGRRLRVREDLSHCAGRRGALRYPSGQLGESRDVCRANTEDCGDRVEVCFPCPCVCVCCRSADSDRLLETSEREVKKEERAGGKL